MVYLKFLVHVTKRTVASIGWLKGAKMTLCEKTSDLSKKGIES